jgi:hypothetical protein
MKPQKLHFFCELKINFPKYFSEKNKKKGVKYFDFTKFYIENIQSLCFNN